VRAWLERHDLAGELHRLPCDQLVSAHSTGINREGEPTQLKVDFGKVGYVGEMRDRGPCAKKGWEGPTVFCDAGRVWRMPVNELAGRLLQIARAYQPARGWKPADHRGCEARLIVTTVNVQAVGRILPADQPSYDGGACAHDLTRSSSSRTMKHACSSVMAGPRPSMNIAVSVSTSQAGQPVESAPLPTAQARSRASQSTPLTGFGDALPIKRGETMRQRILTEAQLDDDGFNITLVTIRRWQFLSGNIRRPISATVPPSSLSAPSVM